MRRTIVCASCGASLQVSDGDAERALRCPGCRQLLSANAQFAPALPAEPMAPAVRRRLWVLGSLASLLVVVLVVAWWNWPRPERHAPPARVGLRLGTPPLGALGKEGDPVQLGPGEVFIQEAILDLTAPVEARLTEKDVHSGPALEPLGKIPAHVAVAFDSATGWLFVATRDGRLHWVDPQTWRTVGWCTLEQPAYQLVIDAQRRLLYAASCTAEALKLSQLGDRDEAFGDIHVYDLNQALKAPDTLLAPSRRFPLEGQVINLELWPGGDHLVFLAETKTDVELNRLDTRQWTRDQHLGLRVAPPTALAVAPDRSRAYLLAGGKCLTVDTSSWKVIDTVTLGSGVHSIQTDKLGRLYLLEGRIYSQISVVDLPLRKVIARWTMETEGRPYFRIDHAGTKLYVGTSAVTSGRIWCLDVSGDTISQPVRAGFARSSRTGLLRGGLQLLGREPYVIMGSGFVFRGPS